jgi:hypothetical protein
MKQHLFGMAAVIAAAGLSSLFTARRIEAQYSSPVKVVNTTSAPALNSAVDDHGRIPYWSQVEPGFDSGEPCDGRNGCVFTFGPVPAGHRLVVERVSGDLGLTGFVSELVVSLSAPAAVTLPNFYTFFDAPVTGNFDVPILAFIDSQQTVAVQVVAVGGGTFTGGRRIILTGYLLDCLAAPCSAIAH